MADYNTMKVPELKKLLSERGLTQAGNKADLIVRLVDNDKAKASEETPAGADTKKPDLEDEIDYEDDDYPAAPVAAPAAKTTEKATTSTPAPAAATASSTTKTPAAAPAPAKSTPAPVTATETSTTEPKTAAPATTTDTTTKTADAPAAPASESGADKPNETATPAFSQHLAPTNAQTEAEKRAARAARFGITVDKESEEAQKVTRASRFGIANEAVSALDSALPDRPRKRGRGGEDKEEEQGRATKRRSGGAGGPTQVAAAAPRNGPATRNNRSNQKNTGNASTRTDTRQTRRGRTPQEGAANGQKKAGGVAKAAPKTVDPAEKAKLEARAKRFATGAK